MKQVNNNNLDWPATLDDYCKCKRVASTDIIKIIKMTLTDLAKDTALRVTVPHYIVSCGGGLDDSITAVDVSVINDNTGDVARAVIDVSETVVSNDLTAYAADRISLRRVYDGDGIVLMVSLALTTREIVMGGYCLTAHTPYDLRCALRRMVNQEG